VEYSPLIVLGLPLLLLMFFLMAVLVRVKLGHRFCFGKLRPGLKGKPVEMLKFRSMTDERDANGKLLVDSERLTRFGKFLRSF
jgi:lipopolysaccharide/colanic/teichoic acid biosynthesis glycosyltransferase